MKLVTFDVSSPFAFFRKNFTTVNALTFSVIPRSAVEGLVGSILGLSREEFPGLLGKSKISVQLLSKARKVNVKYMHVNHDWWHGPLHSYLSGKQYLSIKGRPLMSTAASVELLRDVKYRIYVDTNNEEINNKLATNLRNKQSYYTPYLGSSSYMCSLKYIGEFDYGPVGNGGNEYLPVSSLVPYLNNKIPKLQLKPLQPDNKEKGFIFASEEDIPIHLDKERKSYGTYSVVYNTSVGSLPISDKEIVMVDKDTYVKFLPTSI